MDHAGKMVRVSYKGFFDDGAVFIDQRAQPIEFPCIDGWMPPVFIETTRSMAVGETRTVRVGANEAYEEHTDERVLEVKRANIPASVKLVVGEMVNLEDPTGQTYPARLIELTDDKAVFDRNHDAIAKALNFEITLLDVSDLPNRTRPTTDL
ncbi:MAG: FKBP-type peptidyl-prolyl cis-trans isomerase [Gordonibacter sp.]|uniref:FKBP-type peptidyl-prolyl cis-trans isomerase n=1 Tax=Gordonibacter sp. TaxID=1968902 RepID=UPI002FC7D274